MAENVTLLTQIESYVACWQKKPPQPAIQALQPTSYWALSVATAKKGIFTGFHREFSLCSGTAVILLKLASRFSAKKVRVKSETLLPGIKSATRKRELHTVQDSEKLCGQWGPFLYGDPIVFRAMRWRVAMYPRRLVPNGRVPIKPEDEEAEGITGVITISMDDALGCRV